MLPSSTFDTVFATWSTFEGVISGSREPIVVVMLVVLVVHAFTCGVFNELISRRRSADHGAE